MLINETVESHNSPFISLRRRRPCCHSLLFFSVCIIKSTYLQLSRRVELTSVELRHIKIPK